MQEFDASIVLDNLQLKSEQLAEFVCNITEFMVDQKNQAIENSFKQLVGEFEKLSVNKSEKETLDETLALLQDAIATSEVNKILVKALIANLKPFKQLKKPITQLLSQLDID